MNINNIGNSQNFKSLKTNSEKKEEEKPTLEKNVSKAIENIYTRSERAVPENGDFTGIECQFSIPDTDITGSIVIVHDKKEPKEKRCLFVRALGAYQEESRSTLILNDTKENIRKYLETDDAKKEIKSATEQLSNSIIKNRF